MTKLRILIVDDESLARARIRSFLCGDDSIEIAGECENGIEALAAIRGSRPDIVLLDVQMPGCDSFQLLAELPAGELPAIILVTAHARFAVDAFAAQVIDYLLKPFDRERLQLALKRAAKQIRMRRESDLRSEIAGMIATAPPRPPDRIVVKSDGRILFLKPGEIIWVEAANNYSTLHLASAKRLLIRETLSSIEKRLGSPPFARVNRSAVVHMDQVKELHPAKYGDYQVVLSNGVRLPLSRGLRGQLAKFAAEPI